MAHKKKNKLSRHHHRPRVRRMGAPGGSIMGDAEMLVGLMGGSVLATAAQKHMTSFDPKIVSGLQVVGGIMLKNRFGGSIMQGVGYGVAGAGAIGLAHEFGVMRGIDEFVQSTFSPFPAQMPQGHETVMIPGSSVPPMAMPMAGLYNENLVSGLDNDAMMSGLGNDAMMSGGDDMPSYKNEYESVNSLGF